MGGWSTVELGGRAGSIGLTSQADLFHDVGHDLATLGLLVASIRAEPHAAAANQRMALLEAEINRLQLLVGTHGHGDDDEVALRAELAGIVAARAAATTTAVVLKPGPEVVQHTNRCLLDRLVLNLLDNAIRAAGPTGHVEVEIGEGPPPLVRVLDNGPGPTQGPRGWAGRGLEIVHSLAPHLGATVTLQARPGGTGTLAEVMLHTPDRHSVPSPRIPTG